MSGQIINGVATLSSSLLARKGQARPAMRSQGFGGFAASGHPLDDLGWNDMGRAEVGHETDADIVAAHLAGGAAEPELPDVPLPAVLVERAALAAEVAPLPTPPDLGDAPTTPNLGDAPTDTLPAAVRSVSVATATRLRRETARAGKSAFTLRLDADRHLRMRLASAITNRSAQALVAQALDQLLSTLPEVDILVAQLPPATRRTK